MFDSLKCYLINTLCCILYQKEYRKYMRANDVEAIQKGRLFEILSKNASTKYGAKYHFKELKTIQDFQVIVPITTYEDYHHYIEDISKGEKKVLTEEAVLLFEPTSGSVSATKLVPYTQGLKDEFQGAIKPWVYDIYKKYKGVKWGRSYWSVSPATSEKRYTECGIPIGFEADTEYFGKLEKRLFDEILAVPGDVSRLSDIEDFYFQTSLGLLQCENLTLISVWNPTFLILILEYMTKNSKVLCDRFNKVSKKRSSEIEKLLISKMYSGIWKKLRVISCWCDANAYQHAEELRRMFPHVLIQPKGLLATEGVVSFPIANENGARLAVNSHFYEFEDTKSGRIFLAHELEVAAEYVVIITTSGGFYRYRMNDMVTVTGKENGFPLLRFIGKADRVSDLFGEKLNEIFVMGILERHIPKDEFYMVAPEADHYVLYTGAEVLAREIDLEFRRNFHYDYCRKLGQLKELKVFKLSGNPEREYIETCQSMGQKLGDIKQARLSTRTGWDKIFTGNYGE